YREGEAISAPRSRGELTSRFLQYPGEMDDYAQQCLAQGVEYGGFNLLLGDRQRLFYCSNRQRQAKKLEAGIYSLSNHLLDTPWPKAVHAREALREIIAGTDPDPQQLLSALQRDEPYGDELLPDTGVGIELERLLSPPFIHSEHYGTRCTTVLIQDREGETTLLEQSYLPRGRKGELRRFSIPPHGQ
ncbi:MAG: NRDE family protein, partial [Gammaproteobacteria bacterium]